MLRHLIVKHQSFAEWRLAPTKAGAKYLGEVYDVIPEREAQAILEDVRPGGGILIVGHHFGMYKSLPSAIAVGHGVRVSAANYVSAHYAPSTFQFAARLAYSNAISTAKNAPVPSDT